MISGKALKEYLETGAIPGGPLTVHIDITNKCNLNCVTCWNYSPYLAGAKDPAWKKLELSLEVFREILADLRSINVKKLIISGGGEPFTHAGIYSMISEANAARFDVTVITNATLIDVEKLLADPPAKLLVNLCAASAETYVRFHPNRVEGDFHVLRRNLREINRQVPLNLAMVISNINYFEVAAAARLAAGFPRVRLSFKPAALTPGTQRFALSAEQEQELLHRETPRCREICREKNIENNLDVFESQLRGGNAEYPIRETGCFAGLFYSRIYTSGEVFFCCAHIKVGSILEKPFSQIWQDEAYNKVRALMDRKEFFPECKTCGKYNLNFKARQFIEADGIRSL